MSKTTENNNAFLMHLSSFAGYFFPFGAIIVPLVFWESKKKESELLNRVGKEVINFNLSYLLYFIGIVVVMASLGLSIAINEVDQLNLFLLISMGIILSILGITKFVLIIIAAIKGNQGEEYKYPLTINFIK
jgi:uncharacterized Tic20 family protein